MNDHSINDVLEDFVADAMDESDSFGSLMANIETSMTQLMKSTSKAPSDLREHFAAFLSALTWTDNIFKYLLAFHLVLFVLLIISRNSFGFQIFLFFFASALVFLSERFNAFGQQHWQMFGTQNYFDSSGAFMGIFFSGPLLLLLFCLLVRPTYFCFSYPFVDFRRSFLIFCFIYR